MFENLCEPFPSSKQLNKVARYVSKLYPKLCLNEWWTTKPTLSKVYYRILYNCYTVGGLFEDKDTNDVFLVLNTNVNPDDGDYKSRNTIENIGCELVVKWLECVPILSLNHVYNDNIIIFKVTREDIPNV